MLEGCSAEVCNGVQLRFLSPWLWHSQEELSVFDTLSFATHQTPLGGKGFPPCGCQTWVGGDVQFPLPTIPSYLETLAQTALHSDGQ